jgi:predicted GTPase
MGYGNQQTRELEETINRSDADLVLIGTPIDLNRIVKINKPTQRCATSCRRLDSLPLRIC